MPNETKAYPSGMPIPQAEYYEMAPEVHVGSWSPSPAGTPPAQYIKPSQVHMRIGTPPGRCGVVRFKGPGTLDEIIDALYMHRVDVFGPRSVLMQAVLDQVRTDALEEAASLHESIRPACDHERENGSPGAGAMGAVIEYRDKIRALKNKKAAR